jgi:hypothetical protein
LSYKNCSNSQNNLTLKTIKANVISCENYKTDQSGYRTVHQNTVGNGTQEIAIQTAQIPNKSSAHGPSQDQSKIARNLDFTDDLRFAPPQEHISINYCQGRPQNRHPSITHSRSGQLGSNSLYPTSNNHKSTITITYANQNTQTEDLALTEWQNFQPQPQSQIPNLKNSAMFIQHPNPNQTMFRDLHSSIKKKASRNSNDLNKLTFNKKKFIDNASYDHILISGKGNQGLVEGKSHGCCNHCNCCGMGRESGLGRESRLGKELYDSDTNSLLINQDMTGNVSFPFGHNDQKQYFHPQACDDEIQMREHEYILTNNNLSQLTTDKENTRGLENIIFVQEPKNQVNQFPKNP